MIYYNAGCNYPEKIYEVMENYLASYHYKHAYKNQINSITNLQRLIMDSGAWSAKQKNTTINIDDYMEFIRQENIKHYITLDVIGDKNATLQNYKIMLEAGLNPLPVWQLDMPIDTIEKHYLVNNSDIICIGGVAGKLGPKPLIGQGEMRLIDRVFNTYKKTKFHILGNMSRTLWRWPVYSCDSTTLLHVRITAKKHIIRDNNLITIETPKIKKQTMIRQMLSSYHAYQYYAEEHTLYWRNKGVDHWGDQPIKYNHKNIITNTLYECGGGK